MSKQINLLKRKFSFKKITNNGVKNFEDIPGPKGIFGIGNFYNYFKLFGKYRFDELHKANIDKYNKYGPIICERMFRDNKIVWLYDPNDFAQLFNDGLGNLPSRVSHFALEKYRQDHPEIYNGGGLVMANGQEWTRLRKNFQKGLASLKNVRDFLPHSDEVVKEFIHMLPSRANEDAIVENMVEELERLTFETYMYVVFNKRFNSFTEKERNPHSISSKLIQAGEDNNNLSIATDQGMQIWRYFNTPTFQKLIKIQKFTEKIVQNLIENLKRNKSSGNCVLDSYFLNPNLDQRDIFTVAVDFTLSTQSTSYVLAFILHHISKDKLVQDLLHEEAKKVLPRGDDESIFLHILDYEIPYTRAVFKEAQRLNPVSMGVSRILTEDKVFSNYHVPKYTAVITQNFVACRLEENFADPLKFNPDRWLRTNSDIKINPHLVMPFGIGLRSCISRYLAQQLIHTLLIRLMRNYELEWKGENNVLDFKTVLVNQPSSLVSIKLKKR